MPRVFVRSLQHEEIPLAARLLAAGMRDNPLHQRVFSGRGDGLESVLTPAFNQLLGKQLRTGDVLGAYDGNALVGITGMAAPGHCQPGLVEKLSMLRLLARGRQLRSLPRIRIWLRHWERHDPDFDHWHLGPAAVDRSLQGRGIGSELMTALCRRLDELQKSGYLETDKPENVRLYRRGGFKVVATQPVLGVTNWFMLRRPRHEPIDAINPG